jgi:hypothetical protein
MVLIPGSVWWESLLSVVIGGSLAIAGGAFSSWFGGITIKLCAGFGLAGERSTRASQVTSGRLTSGYLCVELLVDG